MDGCLPYVIRVRISRWMPCGCLGHSGGVTYINLTFDKRRKKGDRKKSSPALNWAQRDPLTHTHKHTSQSCCLSVIEFHSRLQPTSPCEIICLSLFSTWKTTRLALYFENPTTEPSPLSSSISQELYLEKVDCSKCRPSQFSLAQTPQHAIHIFLSGWQVLLPDRRSSLFTKNTVTAQGTGTGTEWL